VNYEGRLKREKSFAGERGEGGRKRTLKNLSVRGEKKKRKRRFSSSFRQRGKGETNQIEEGRRKRREPSLQEKKKKEKGREGVFVQRETWEEAKRK